MSLVATTKMNNQTEYFGLVTVWSVTTGGHSPWLAATRRG
jgi:hypothetical protein